MAPRSKKYVLLIFRRKKKLKNLKLDTIKIRCNPGHYLANLADMWSIVIIGQLVMEIIYNMNYFFQYHVKHLCPRLSVRISVRNLWSSQLTHRTEILHHVHKIKHKYRDSCNILYVHWCQNYNRKTQKSSIPPLLSFWTYLSLTLFIIDWKY